MTITSTKFGNPLVIPAFYLAAKGSVGIWGLNAKVFSTVANLVGFTGASEKLNYAGDRLISFATSWGLGSMPEVKSPGLSTKTVSLLVVAAPAAATLGSRAVAGALGLGAKGAGKVAQKFGSERAEKNLNSASDSLISFATRKDKADLKAGAALTAAAAVTAFLAKAII